jgi:signal transduction histidine kinase
VRQIVRNLLTNAERYGGSVVTIHISRVDDRVLVAVADDGPGLPRHEWDKVFEPYHRGHQTPGRPGSVGIGLAISRQLAELMGGTLTYLRDQRRSVFLLTLRAGRD